MAMLNATDLKAGITFRLDGQVWRVLKYEHTKMGRGSATIKVKARSLDTGAITEKSFISGARVEMVETSKQEMTFLYADEQVGFFMNTQTYEQVEVPLSVIGDDSSYLQEGIVVYVLILEEGDSSRPAAIELPPKITYEVVEAEPGVKGDSAANMLKKATLANGIEVKVPLFIKTGDKIRIDTRTGDYAERVSS